MKWLFQVIPALVLSYLIAAVFVGLIGLFLKAWYLIFMFGWNSL